MTYLNRGFIGLISVIIIGAIMLIIGVTTASIGQTQLQVAYGTHEEHRTRDYAAACLEEAILRLKRNPSYVGPTTVPLAGLTAACTVDSVGADPADPFNTLKRRVLVTSTVENFTKKADVRLERKTNPDGQAVAWVVTSWSEIDP